MIGICAKCGKEQEMTPIQKWHSKRGDKYFCSKECRYQYNNFRIDKEKKCQKCGKIFIAKYKEKKFCSLECYNSSEQFKNRMQKFNEYQKKQKIDVICANCGKELKIKKSQKGKRNFCNKKCYREFLANRFDRYIVSCWQIDKFNNYDEFLSQEKLKCPIKGCDWEGDNLSFHVNIEHGINSYEFKKMCGFNRKSGIVSQPLSIKMSMNAKKRGSSWLKPKKPYELLGRRIEEYADIRPEGIEHMKKAKMMQKQL